MKTQERGEFWLVIGLFTPSAAALILLFLALFPSPAFSGDRFRPGFAITNVDVLTMTEAAVLEDHTVLVQDDRIVSVGPPGSVEVPPQLTIIDGQGKWLMPGMIEMHAHIPGEDSLDFRETVLNLFVANGVTTVRNMRGEKSHLALREDIRSGKTFGPQLYTSSPWLGHDNAETPAMARQAVARYAREGYDLLKIGELPRPAYLAMALAANDVGIPFGGHVPKDVSLPEALQAGQSSIDHLDGYVRFLSAPDGNSTERDSGFFGSALVDFVDKGRLDAAVKLTRRSGVWIVPTMSHFEHLASAEDPRDMIEWPEMVYIPSRIRRNWVEAKEEFSARDDFKPTTRKELTILRREILRSLYRGGANIAGGSDAPQFFNVPGFSLHRELQMMVASGMKPIDALLAVTRAPAAHLGAKDQFGTIAPGLRADLILLSANPIDDINNIQRIEAVVLNGRWIDRAELDLGLAEARKRSESASPFSRKESAFLAAIGIAVILGASFLVVRSRSKLRRRRG